MYLLIDKYVLVLPRRWKMEDGSAVVGGAGPQAVDHKR
jgi:hypothetical protein